MNHTPGPWEMSGQLVVGPPQPCPNPKAQPWHPTIASVAWDFDGDRNATGELPWSIAKHNGKLICAAPELLAALDDLLLECGLACQMGGWNGSTTIRSMERSRAAIAKARGQ